MSWIMLKQIPPGKGNWYAYQYRSEWVPGKGDAPGKSRSVYEDYLGPIDKPKAAEALKTMPVVGQAPAHIKAVALPPEFGEGTPVAAAKLAPIAEVKPLVSRKGRTEAPEVPQPPSPIAAKAPEVAPPVAQAPKQPWEMTRAEYAIYNWQGLLQRFRDRPDILDNHQRDEEIARFKQWHLDAVDRALSEGKPVPEAVLNDYPDLLHSQRTQANAPVPKGGLVKRQANGSYTRIAKTIAPTAPTEADEKARVLKAVTESRATEPSWRERKKALKAERAAAEALQPQGDVGMVAEVSRHAAEAEASMAKTRLTYPNTVPPKPVEQSPADLARWESMTQTQADYNRKTRAAVLEALKAGDAPLTVDKLDVGTVIVDHAGGVNERLEVNEITDEGLIYAAPEDDKDPGAHQHLIGDIADYTIAVDNKPEPLAHWERELDTDVQLAERAGMKQEPPADIEWERPRGEGPEWVSEKVTEDTARKQPRQPIHVGDIIQTKDGREGEVEVIFKVGRVSPYGAAAPHLEFSLRDGGIVDEADVVRKLDRPSKAETALLPQPATTPVSPLPTTAPTTWPTKPGRRISIGKDSGKVFLESPYDARLVDAIKADLPGRAWNKDKKHWELPPIKTRADADRLRRFAEKHGYELSPGAIRDLAAQGAIEAPPETKPEPVPLPKEPEALKPDPRLARFDELQLQLAEAMKDPRFTSISAEGRELRSRVIDMERELEELRPVAISRAEQEIAAGKGLDKQQIAAIIDNGEAPREAEYGDTSSIRGPALQGTEPGELGAASPGLSAEEQAGRVPRGEGERQPSGALHAEGERGPEVRPSTGERGGVRGPSLVSGDLPGDLRAGDRLEPAPPLQLPSPTPIGNTRDIILGPEYQATLAAMGPAARFDANLDAIRTLKRVEAENRPATAEEQATIARFSGFGDSAFNEAFPNTRSWRSNDSAWERRRQELKDLATEDEYHALEASRKNAFYTTPDVVGATWAGLERLGVNNLSHPRVLEPSAGSGRFLGMQSVELAARSQRTAVELDKFTGRMLKQTFPNTNVYVMGYQDAPIANDSVDIALSNVPFGNYPVTDRAFRKGRQHLSRQIHNYFFAKTLDKLRPGGVLAFVTSHGTLDASRAQPVREALAEQADFLGAIRLPKTAFPDTQVVTDIIFMRKRQPGEPPGDTSWVKSSPVTFKAAERYWDPEQRSMRDDVEHHVNQYFLDHPEMVLGTHSAAGSMRRTNEYTVEPIPGQDLKKALDSAVQRLPENVITEAPVTETRATETDTAPNVRANAYVITDDGTLKIKRVRTDRGIVEASLEPTGLTSHDEYRVRKMLEIRDAGQAVLQAQLRDAPADEIKATQATLTEVYDAYVVKHGPLNADANADMMKQDPDGAFLRALEQWNPQKGDDKWDKTKLRDMRNATTLDRGQLPNLKMPIFEKVVVRGLTKGQSAKDASDALAVSLNETGRVDVNRMGELLGRSPDDVRRELADARLIFKNPVGDWEPADQYLTGNVRTKLTEAEAAASADRAYQGNVEALRAVQPLDIPSSQIGIRLGASWVPEYDVNTFVYKLLDTQAGRSGKSRFFRYEPVTGKWVRENDIKGNEVKERNQWGTERMSGHEIVERLLNSEPIEVTMRDPNDPEGKKRVRDVKSTLAAQEKAKAIQAAFEKWAWDDGERAERLSRIYNDTFNNLRPRRFDGSHQALPGMDRKWYRKLHQHQKDAIWRTVNDGTVLLAHEVGFGKTAVMVGAGMELRRLGLARKNLYVVPKATHEQFKNQFFEVYPYAKVLAPTEDDFTPEKRGEFLNRIATGDWDAVVVADSQFKTIPVRPETEAKFLRQEIENIRSAMLAEEQDGNKGSKSHKELQEALTKAEEQLKKRMLELEEQRKGSIYFDDLGVDQMFVDEADAYKNLPYITRMQRVKGLPASKSQRAWDMYLKCRTLQSANKGRGVVFATGTPIANTIAELYTMQRYLQQPALEERGLQHFDNWAKTFGTVTEDIEQTPTGLFKPTRRFAKFVNAPELSNMWQATADIRVADEEPSIVRLRPKLVNDAGQAKRTVVASPPDQALLDYMGELVKRAEDLPNVDPREDNMLKIANDARLASLDMRMKDKDAPENPRSKINNAAVNIARIYKETDKDKGTQLVFLDIGIPKTRDEVSDSDSPDTAEETGAEQELLTNMYGEIRRKIVERGVPIEKVAYIHQAKNDKQKAAMYDKVNDGTIRVLIGSTGKMGAGVNVQERAAALHHLDAPWRPRDIEQREGRVIRQGNKVYGPQVDDEGHVVDPGPGVHIYTYVTERSFDAFMWQAIEAKAKAIKTMMRRGDVPRTVEDADTFVMSAAEAKAIATGNPDVMNLVKARNDLQRLRVLQAAHRDATMYARQETNLLPKTIADLKERIAKVDKDAAHVIAIKDRDFAITVGSKSYSERGPAGDVLRDALHAQATDGREVPYPTIGEYRGFTLKASKVVTNQNPQGLYQVIVEHPATGYVHTTSEFDKSVEGGGILQRIANTVNGIPQVGERMRENLAKQETNLAGYQERLSQPFEDQAEIDQMEREVNTLEKRLAGELNEPTAARASGSDGNDDDDWDGDPDLEHGQEAIEYVRRTPTRLQV